MKKYFIVSDVHSFYNELMAALNKCGWEEDNPNHILISLGDLCDRGPDAVKCLKFANKLYKQGRAILIRGNHEDLMEEVLEKHYLERHDFHNCTHETIMQVTKSDIYEEGEDAVIDKMKRSRLWGTYFKSTVDFAEIGDNIFVHGWIPIQYKTIEEEGYEDLPKVYWPTAKTYNPNWRHPVWEDDWKEARWLNGMKMWNQGIREPGKTIWCGHYHTSWGHSNLHNDGKEFLDYCETYYIDPDTGRQEPHENFEPFYDDGIVAIDSCCAYSHFLNCVTLEVDDDIQG